MHVRRAPCPHGVEQFVCSDEVAARHSADLALDNGEHSYGGPGRKSGSPELTRRLPEGGGIPRISHGFRIHCQKPVEKAYVNWPTSSGSSPGKSRLEAMPSF